MMPGTIQPHYQGQNIVPSVSLSNPTTTLSHGNAPNYNYVIPSSVGPTSVPQQNVESVGGSQFMSFATNAPHTSMSTPNTVPVLSTAVPTGITSQGPTSTDDDIDEFQSFSSAPPSHLVAGPTSNNVAADGGFQEFVSVTPSSQITTSIPAGVSADIEEFAPFSDPAPVQSTSADDFGDFSAFSSSIPTCQADQVPSSSKALPSFDGKRINILYKNSGMELKPISKSNGPTSLQKPGDNNLHIQSENVKPTKNSK